MDRDFRHKNIPNTYVLCLYELWVCADIWDELEQYTNLLIGFSILTVDISPLCINAYAILRPVFNISDTSFALSMWLIPGSPLVFSIVLSITDFSFFSFYVFWLVIACLSAIFLHLYGQGCGPPFLASYCSEDRVQFGCRYAVTVW